MKILIIALLVLAFCVSCGNADIDRGTVIGKSFKSATIHHPMICTITIQDGDVTRTVAVTPEVYCAVGFDNWFIVD